MCIEKEIFDFKKIMKKAKQISKEEIERQYPAKKKLLSEELAIKIQKLPTSRTKTPTFNNLSRRRDRELFKTMVGTIEKKLPCKTLINTIEKKSLCKTLANTIKKPEKKLATTTKINEQETININNSDFSLDPLGIIGELLQKKYKVKKFLGQGGMGAVYLVDHVLLEKERAIKILLKSPLLEKKDIDRFFLEASLASSIEHSNVIKVYDIEEIENFYFIVMEYIDGIDLNNYIEEEGIFKLDEALEIMKLVARGLQAIHKLNLVHRDIKPCNLMITKSAEVKIMDFGIVKNLIADNALTTINTILGTPKFMPPEIITNSSIDLRSDIYSLGATFYYMLTGKYCFVGSTMQIMHQTINFKPHSPRYHNPEIPEGIANIILKMLEKDPKDRFQSMNNFEMELKKFEIHEKV